MITDRIKTLADACRELGITEPIKVEVPPFMQDDADSIQAYTELIIITRALNEGWEPDWGTLKGWKYCPWFEIVCSGETSISLCLSETDYVSAFNGICVPSRLCFKSHELAIYAAEQFKETYARFFLIK